MVEGYFKRPILWDFVISTLIIGSLVFFQMKGLYHLPEVTKVISVSDDIGTIGLTVSGFVITIITILLTLKSGQILSEDELKNDSPPFKIFLASSLYTRSIEILKYGVILLVLVSMTSYILKMSLPDCLIQYMHYFNILGLVAILATFLRSFYVLGKILKMQGD